VRAPPCLWGELQQPGSPCSRLLPDLPCLLGGCQPALPTRCCSAMGAQRHSISSALTQCHTSLVTPWSQILGGSSDLSASGNASGLYPYSPSSTGWGPLGEADKVRRGVWSHPQRHEGCGCEGTCRVLQSPERMKASALRRYAFIICTAMMCMVWLLTPASV
jgi:hypothetical protein